MGNKIPSAVLFWILFRYYIKQIDFMLLCTCSVLDHRRCQYYILYCILYYTILYYTILYYTIPYHTIQTELGIFETPVSTS